MKKAFGGQGCEIGNAFVENEKKSKLKKNNLELFVHLRCGGVEFKSVKGQTERWKYKKC